jgi:hypothetical protein
MEETKDNTKIFLVIVSIIVLVLFTIGIIVSLISIGSGLTTNKSQSLASISDARKYQVSDLKREYTDINPNTKMNYNFPIVIDKQ